MRQVLVPLLVCVLVLLAPPLTQNPQANEILRTVDPRIDHLSYVTSAAGGNGDDSTATMFMSREIADQSVSVMNTYTNTANHNGTLNLTQHLISGWTLYNVTMKIENVTASLEQEVVGSNWNSDLGFRIYEYNTIQNFRYNSLAQGFYKQPHDGLLNNYSIFWWAATYSASHGTANLVVRSDYTLSSTNITSPVDLPHVTFENRTEIITDQANLSANNEYFVVLDGMNLIEASGFYPDIRWWADNSEQIYTTEVRDTATSAWIDFNSEGFLNYTYTPWNMTTNSALVYPQPQNITLRGNSTVLSNSSVWTYTTTNKNITSIDFDSNQSIHINHNLTLWYKKEIPSQTVWDIPDSGGVVNWNKTISLDYPEIDMSSFVNLTRMIDWTATGLYNGTSTNIYNNYTVDATTVTCSNMTNGTWTMTFTAFNYLTDIDTLESRSIVDDLSITALIKDESSVNATDGSTNLTIWQDTTKISNPSNETVTNGASEYLWDIDNVMRMMRGGTDE